MSNRPIKGNAIQIASANVLSSAARRAIAPANVLNRKINDAFEKAAINRIKGAVKRATVPSKEQINRDFAATTIQSSLRNKKARDIKVELQFEKDINTVIVPSIQNAIRNKLAREKVKRVIANKPYADTRQKSLQNMQRDVVVQGIINDLIDVVPEQSKILKKQQLIAKTKAAKQAKKSIQKLSSSEIMAKALKDATDILSKSKSYEYLLNIINKYKKQAKKIEVKILEIDAGNKVVLNDKLFKDYYDKFEYLNQLVNILEKESSTIPSKKQDKKAELIQQKALKKQELIAKTKAAKLAKKEAPVEINLSNLSKLNLFHLDIKQRETLAEDFVNSLGKLSMSQYENLFNKYDAKVNKIIEKTKSGKNENNLQLIGKKQYYREILYYLKKNKYELIADYYDIAIMKKAKRLRKKKEKEVKKTAATTIATAIKNKLEQIKIVEEAKTKTEKYDAIATIAKQENVKVNKLAEIIKSKVGQKFYDATKKNIRRIDGRTNTTIRRINESIDDSKQSLKTPLSSYFTTKFYLMPKELSKNKSDLKDYINQKIEYEQILIKIVNAKKVIEKEKEVELLLLKTTDPITLEKVLDNIKEIEITEKVIKQDEANVYDKIRLLDKYIINKKIQIYKVSKEFDDKEEQKALEKAKIDEQKAIEKIKIAKEKAIENAKVAELKAIENAKVAELKAIENAKVAELKAKIAEQKVIKQAKLAELQAKDKAKVAEQKAKVIEQKAKIEIEKAKEETKIVIQEIKTNAEKVAQQAKEFIVNNKRILEIQKQELSPAVSSISKASTISPLILQYTKEEIDSWSFDKVKKFLVEKEIIKNGALYAPRKGIDPDDVRFAYNAYARFQYKKSRA